MRPIAKFLALALAALAFVAAGCGDDDEATDTGASGATGASGPPLTQDEFIAQADAICKSSGQDVDQQANELFGGGQPSQEEIEQFATDVFVPSLRDQAESIRALTPPEGDEDEINAMLDDLDSAIDQVEEDPSLIAAGDAGPFADVNEEAQDYGLEECGSG